MQVRQMAGNGWTRCNSRVWQPVWILVLVATGLNEHFIAKSSSTWPRPDGDYHLTTASPAADFCDTFAYTPQESDIDM